jgi:peptidoglycan/xylan/chitin deacetylase (PgdA/CDA1 family)/glycosyltransferase involved in cell wall biosynthesis
MRFSVVIPTRQRREIVVGTIDALARQRQRDFEVIVVSDGSTDGTATALHALHPSFPLTVVEQEHRGAAAARNGGAAVARGELLLFLDDDMEADPALLLEHDRSHRLGADLVLGDLPLHPESPPTALAAATGRWAERRRERLALSEGQVPVTDLLSGQMSISHEAFERLGGFDVGFTRGGLVPGADRDFGYRARKAGLRVVFNPAAISYQRYDVGPADYTRRSRDGARADEVLRSMYPEIADELWTPRFDTRLAAATLGTLVSLPRGLSAPARRLAVLLFSRPAPGRLSSRLFFAVQTMERLRGAREARRMLARPLAVVVAYHSISDLRGDPILREYGVPPERFAAQLEALARRRWRFIGLDELLDALDGRGSLPRRAVLITFDDGYADLLGAARILAGHQAPAVVFAVADHAGGTNDWRRPAATELPLLDRQALQTVAASGIAVGAHGLTHRSLVALPPGELEGEVRGSAERLVSLGLPRPTVFAYPYGQWSADTAAAVREAGFAAAFTVEPGAVRRSLDRYALPRIEVSASDSPRKLAFKLATAGRRDARRTPLRVRAER